MPRTAPTVDGTPNMKKASFRFIDVSGDRRAVQVYLELTATAAQIESLAAAIGAATNASLYSIVVEDIYNSVALANQAVAAEENSVFDNIVILYKEGSSPQGQDFFLPAPIRACFVGDTDNPDAASTELGAVRDAAAVVMIGTVVAISMRYTERREKNQAVPALE